MIHRAWKPQVCVDGRWSGNRLVFATRQEALGNARALMERDVGVERIRALMVRDPVNAAWEDGQLAWPISPDEGDRDD